MSTIKPILPRLQEPVLRELSSPHIKWLASEMFEVSGVGSRMLKLTEDHLVLCDELEKIQGVLALDFNAKFSTIPGTKHNQYAGLLLYGKQSGSPVEIRHASPDVVNLWKEFLLQRINRLGFKMYFKTTMKIGKGSFASVHLALGLESNFRVAIKSYDMTETPRRQAVMNEITILRSINHPNLNRIFGVYQQDGKWHIIIELFDGGQLAYKFQSKYRFNSHEIKTIVKSLLLGLEHLHNRNIYHRDIKPQNIMFRAKNLSDVVIVDFGLSTFVNSKNYLFYRCGTPGFMAPEVLKVKNIKKKADPIGDIFSVGLILHILLTGESLFTADSYDELIEQNQLCNFDLEAPIYSIFTRATVDLLKKMLDTNPFTRISAEQALGHPFFTQKQVMRANRSVQALSTLISLDSYSVEQIEQLSCKIVEARRYRSREKSAEDRYKYMMRHK